MTSPNEHRFTIDDRQVVATFAEFSGRLFVNRLCQVVKRPRAYGEVTRKLWPTASPNAIARAALDHLGASRNGLIDPDKAAALVIAGNDDNERQARSRKVRAEAGGKQIAVMLTPAAVSKLAALQAQGESIAGAINRLLVESKP